MKCNLLSFALFCSIAGILTSCNGSGKKTDKDSINIISVDTLPGINEVEGVAGDGTSMNQLELITKSGDTIYVSTPDEMIMGGVNVGDNISVVYFSNKDENVANVAVNLSALQHVWTQKALDGHSQSLELDKNGVAITYNMKIEYNAWEFKDGFLLLYSPKNIASEKGNVVDTFQIIHLSDTELVLANHDIETIFTMDN